jgi:hypothetical protein
MARKRGDADPKFMVEIGSERFDPKEEAARARRRAASDKKRLAAVLNLEPEAIRGAERELWIVQLAQEPDLETIERYRDEYDLRLTAGLSSLTFIEAMTPGTADRVRREPQVRACIPYWSELKAGRSSLLSVAAATGERLLRLGFAESPSATLLERLDWLGCKPVDTVTPFPGGFILRVKVSEDRDPRDLLLLGEVEWVEEVPSYLEANATSSAVAQGASGPGSNPIWDKGLNGENQIIGVLDTDLPDLAHDFFRDPVEATPSPTHRKVVAITPRGAAPVSRHATRVCGCAVGDDLNASGFLSGANLDRGGAWAAKLVYTDLNPLPAEGKVAAELASSYAHGARVHSMSILEGIADPTKPAPYTADAAAYDAELWRNEYTLLVAAVSNTPNCDPNTKGFAGAPGTAKNPLTVSGLSEAPDQDTFFTGFPGTRDGRRKPDLAAIGENVHTSEPTTATDTSVIAGDCGTSYATPHVAAAAALVRQYFTEGWYPKGKRTPSDVMVPSGALLKAVLLNATVDLKDVPYPSAREGWGRLALARSLHFEGDKLFLRVKDVPHLYGFERTVPATTAKTFILPVPENAKSMKITLVFNDPAGAVGANDPVVNKLDLLVMEPMRSRWDGWELGYFGNDFTDQKVSRRRPLQTGATSFPPSPSELKNNVRQVIIDSPTPGRWGLAVMSYKFDKANTPKEWRRGHIAQGYAWVARVDLS